MNENNIQKDVDSCWSLIKSIMKFSAIMMIFIIIILLLGDLGTKILAFLVTTIILCLLIIYFKGVYIHGSWSIFDWED